jgi:type I restriction enzyme S subunit
MKWSQVSIGRVCSPTQQVDPRTSPEKVFSYVDIASIDRQQKLFGSATEILGAEAPSRARKQIKTNDVLVSTVRPNLNAVAMVPPTLNCQIASTGFCVLRAKPELLLPRFLFYFTRTETFVRSLSQKVKGAHYPAVSENDVRTIAIPLPTLSEQRQIVDILDQANELRRQSVDGDTQFAHVLPVLFNKMFGDPATNPKAWRVGTLNDVIADTQYGTSIKASDNGGGIPVIRMNNIDFSGFLELDDLKYAPIPDEDLRRLKLQEGDILFNRTNSKELVGKTALWTGEISAVAASYLIRVRVKREIVKPEYVWAHLNTPFMKQTLFNRARRAIGMANINAEELRALPVMIPSPEPQETFASHLVLIRDLRNSFQKRGKSLESLFSNLLHRAFAEELTGRWRNAHLKDLLGEIEQQSQLLTLQSEALPC